MTSKDSEDAVLLSLPDELRSAFKDPSGPLYTDPDALLADAGEPLVTVGDVVTYHLVSASRQPDVAIVDGRTEREAVDPEVRETIDGLPQQITVSNPAATLTGDLLTTLVDALESDEPVTIVVDGEEDLATLPAVLVAPDGATVVYGQPGEGMVAVSVDDEIRREFHDRLERMDGDVDRALELLSR